MGKERKIHWDFLKRARVSEIKKQSTPGKKKDEENEGAAPQMRSFYCVAVLC
jgi:hypothetical protein